MTFDQETDDDIITSADLPALRNQMLDYAGEEGFSDVMHSTCNRVIDAIDQACDEDESTHAVLKEALEQFVLVGRREVRLHESKEVASC